MPAVLRPLGHDRRRAGERELTWLEVAGDRARIEAWLGPGHGLPLRIVDGAPALRAVGIGERTFRP